MKLNDINLNNIKVVIFDFDDTLAIHKDKEFSKHRSESEENFVNFYLNAYNKPICFYDEIEPCTKSEILYNFIKNLRKRKIKMYCLSGMKFSFHLKAKQSFINKHYGEDIEVISTSSQELKLKGVKVIQKINNCNLDEILFVDDRQDVIDLLTQNGIKGINVYDIKL
jgi:FMN phosphatase YigB (HAD superfamily)